MKLIVGKYPLCQEAFFQNITMPVGAKPLCVKNIGKTEEPVLYAEIDAESTHMADKTFAIVATGEGLPVGHRKYIGTFTTRHGQFVWHVFEIA